MLSAVTFALSVLAAPGHAHVPDSHSVSVHVPITDTVEFRVPWECQPGVDTDMECATRLAYAVNAIDGVQSAAFGSMVYVSADDAAPTMEDAPGLFNVMIEAFRNKNWPLAIGALSLLLSLLIAAVNAFLFKLTAVTDEARKKILPWLVASGGCLTASGLALIGGAGWFSALVAGFVTSAGAVLLWELAGKRIKNALTKKPNG